MPYLVAAVVAVVATVVLASPGPVVAVLQDNATDVVFSVVTHAPVVALTIDDGPSPSTPAILDVLREHGVKATFFMIGSHVSADSLGAHRVLDEGHEVANHMFVDESSIGLTPEEFETQLLATSSLLESLQGRPFLRPGSGWVNERMVEQAAAHGYRVVLGSVYPFDAQLPAPAVLAWYVLRNVRPGSIIVLHDGRERGERTAQVLRTVLPVLKSKGFRIVTVTDLLKTAAAEGADTAGQ